VLYSRSVFTTRSEAYHFSRISTELLTRRSRTGSGIGTSTPAALPPTDPAVAVALGTAVGPVAIVTEHPAEPGGDVGATVETRRDVDVTPGGQTHADHPVT